MANLTIELKLTDLENVKQVLNVAVTALQHYAETPDGRVAQNALAVISAITSTPNVKPDPQPAIDYRDWDYQDQLEGKDYPNW